MRAGRFLSLIPNLLLASLLGLWLTHISSVLFSFLLVILLFFFFSWFRNTFWPVIGILVLDMIQRLYLGYAGKAIGAHDIYLFLTHLDDVIESRDLVWAVLEKNIPIFIFIVIAVTGLYRFLGELQSSVKARFVLSVLLLFFMGTQTYAGRVIAECAVLGYTQMSDSRKKTENKGTDSNCSKREVDRDVIVVIGESMHYNPEYFDGLGIEVDPVFSGAVNTDTSLPLLFNGAKRVIDLYEKSSDNLFFLAKENGYATAFVSAQSAGNLKYIRPFLYTQAIDYLRTYERDILGEKYDLLLLDELRNLNRTEKSFIVLQMIGEHSPYLFYPQSFSDHSKAESVKRRVREDYRHSVRFSLYVIEKIITHLENQKKRPFTLIFTSDHGELLDKPFGHNQFKPEVYTVPFFIHESDANGKEKVVKHHDIYRMVRKRLGWQCEEASSNNHILIGGTMLSGEDGYFEISRWQDQEISGKHKWF